MVEGEDNICQEGEGDYKERLGDMAMHQETPRQSHGHKIAGIAARHRSAGYQETNEWTKEDVGRPDAFKSAIGHAKIHHPEMQSGENKEQGNKQRPAHVFGDNRHCPGEEKRLKNDTCEQMSIERGRHDLEGIEKQSLSRRVSVKEGRSRMVKSPSGIVAVKFVEHLCFPDLQGVGRKVAAFVVRLFEVEAQMTPDQEGCDAGPKDEEAWPPLDPGSRMRRHRRGFEGHSVKGEVTSEALGWQSRSAR